MNSGLPATPPGSLPADAARVRGWHRCPDWYECPICAALDRLIAAALKGEPDA